MFMKLKILFPWLLGSVWKTHLEEWANQQRLKRVHEITESVRHKTKTLHKKHKSVKTSDKHWEKVMVFLIPAFIYLLINKFIYLFIIY